MNAVRQTTEPNREALRRGWCPSTLKPMETGDGWLVRLHPPGARLTPTQLQRVAGLAQAHGNGLVEISARGNLQLRGVTAASHPALVETLLAESLVDEHEGDGPQRVTVASPLATACGPVDALALAEAIEAGARRIIGLAPKILVVVDVGGALSLDGFACDLRIASSPGGEVVLGLPDGSWRGPVGADGAAAFAVTILQGFASLHRGSPDTIRRLHDLTPDALSALSDLPPTQAPPPRTAPRRAGTFDLGEGRFGAMSALPFGRCDAEALHALAASAERHGTRQLRFSPWRGVACADFDKAAADRWLADAQALGLIVRDDDPRLSVQACAGRPACLRGESEAAADAARLAQSAAPLLAAGLSLHVSGCVKSCAKPGASDLTLVGRAGRYRVVVAGAARDEAIAELDLCEIMARLQPGQDIHARLFETGRNAGRPR